VGRLVVFAGFVFRGCLSCAMKVSFVAVGFLFDFFTTMKFFYIF
jgi:hypothetical protein